jgi:predicted  nucleic acid-binding Zn-ribbon protein
MNIKSRTKSKWYAAYNDAVKENARLDKIVDDKKNEIQSLETANGELEEQTEKLNERIDELEKEALKSGVNDSNYFTLVDKLTAYRSRNHELTLTVAWQANLLRGGE